MKKLYAQNKGRLRELEYSVDQNIRIAGVFDFVNRPLFLKLENTAFWKLDLFPSSGEG
jgi:hypothetical protein